MDKMVIHLGYLFPTLMVYFSPDTNIKRGGHCDERRRHNFEKCTSFASCRENGKFSFQYLIIISAQSFINFNQLVDLSAAQDVEAGDGTTSVVVLAGALLGAAEKMLEKGIHPTIVAESFLNASIKAVGYLTEMSTPVDLNDKASLLRAASTSLNSKVATFLCTEAT
jgi:hypothetical protein